MGQMYSWHLCGDPLSPNFKGLLNHNIYNHFLPKILKLSFKFHQECMRVCCVCVEFVFKGPKRFNHISQYGHTKLGKKLFFLP